MVLSIPDMKIISFASVPNFDKNDFTDRHAIIDPKPLECEETFDRLLRKSSEFQILQNHIDSRLDD